MPPKTKARRNYKKKPMRKNSKGLNKTERKQTQQIAKKVLMKEAESKYFNVRTLSELSGTAGDGAGLTMPISRGNYSQMRVLGFASGTGARTDNLSSLKYGLNTSIQAIQHGRIFASGTATGFDIEGQYVTPSLSISTFNLERLYLSTSSSSADAISAVPYFVRVLRLCPRPKKGSFQTLDPETDAFLDQYSQEIGVRNTNFGHYELKMFKANSKKYQVKQDFSFYLNPPVSYNELDIGAGTFQVSSRSNASHRQMTFKHDIGKKLFYESPATASNPSDGFKNEYILFHVSPIGTANDSTVSPFDVRIACKAVGTFKDV